MLTLLADTVRLFNWRASREGILEIESFKPIETRIDFEELRKREFARVEALPIKIQGKGKYLRGTHQHRLRVQR